MWAHVKVKDATPLRRVSAKAVEPLSRCNSDTWPVRCLTYDLTWILEITVPENPVHCGKSYHFESTGLI